MEYVKLGDYCDITSSKRVFANQYTLDGVPFYRSREIIEKKEMKDISEQLFISQELYDTFRKKFGVPQKGDLLLTSVGTLGIPYIVKDEVFYFKDGNLTWMKNFKDTLNSKYLYYWLNAKFGKDSLVSRAIGSSQPALTIDILKKYKFFIQDLHIQNKIVDILSTYDALIENNNRRIALLEKAAQELYKEWFVRFRFPGYETAEFENGFPKDWRVLPVKETFEIFDTERIPVSSMDRARIQKIYPYYGAAELMDYVDDYIFDGVYLLLGEDGSVMTPKGKPVLQYVWGKFWVNNHAHVLQGKMPFSTEYLHLMFGQMDITGIVTGAAQPKISQGRLFKKKTIIPNLDLVKQFDEIIQPIYKIIRNLKESNQNLTKQRDLLLPRLMSGKLEV